MVRAIDRRRAGIDHLEAIEPPRRLLDHEMTHDVDLHVGARVDEEYRTPAGAARWTMPPISGLLPEVLHRVAIRDIHRVEHKNPSFPQDREPRLLQPNVVECIEIVDADDAIATRQECPGNVVPR